MPCPKNLLWRLQILTSSFWLFDLTLIPVAGGSILTSVVFPLPSPKPLERQFLIWYCIASSFGEHYIWQNNGSHLALWYVNLLIWSLSIIGMHACVKVYIEFGDFKNHKIKNLTKVPIISMDKRATYSLLLYWFLSLKSNYLRDTHIMAAHDYSTITVKK